MSEFLRTHGEYTVSDDRNRIDLDVVHGFLTTSYWATGIEKSRVQRAIDHSFPFGLYHSGRMIGFARVLSDLSALAYLMDVFVIEEYRGEGLGKWIVECVLEYPAFQPVRRWMLATHDAHSLYERYGFGPYEPASDLMMKYDPDKYIKEGVDE